MDKTLQTYLESIQETLQAYKNEQLQTKEYLQTIDELKEWLKERCDENSRN